MAKVVISAVNLVEGGTLSILEDFARALTRHVPREECLFLIHPRAREKLQGQNCMTFTWPKKRWLARVYFEKVYSKALASQLRPQLWVGLHDLTARVGTIPQVLYCHNAAPFFDLPFHFVFKEPNFFCFNRFYKWLYRWGLQSNDLVIVQQDWMRQEFHREFGLPTDRVIVARPFREEPVVRTSGPVARRGSREHPVTLFFPTFPRFFKNVEVLAEAARRTRSGAFRIIVTMKGTENRYAKEIVSRYKSVGGLDFVGLLSRGEVEETYKAVDALVFPSRLESWGLPLTEFQETGKPIFAADLPYARETLSGYPSACFFDPKDPDGLAKLLDDFADGHFRATPSAVRLAPPLARNWDELVRLLKDRFAL